MKEKPKRLPPKSQVMRELWIKSRNQCAFPGCTNPIIDGTGNLVAQLCHIEAAEEGGERFNPNMTNEERRGYDNLIYLCYPHHVETNNVEKYPVSVMKKMKEDHESKFLGYDDEIRDTVKDYDLLNIIYEAKNCIKLYEVMEYGCTLEENIENAHIINNILYKIKEIPIETRRVLSVMITRSYEDRISNCVIPLNEIELVTNKNAQFLLRHIEILVRYGVLSEPDLDDYGCHICYLYGDRNTGWNYWNDIREYCKKTGILVENIIVGLDFRLFDL